MKLNIDKKTEDLASLSSPYYCGSACFLSLLFIIKEVLSSSKKDMRKSFSDIEEVTLSLYENDCLLFALSKKEELSEEELNVIEKTLSDYAILIEKTAQLISICKKAGKERYVRLLETKKKFIVALAYENINVFSERKDMKESFLRVRNDVFVASKRGTHE